MKKLLYIFNILIILVACNEGKEHIAPPIYPQDSASVMTSFGVNTLISDSGVIKYRIVAECWEVNQLRNPTRWTFDKGLFLEQFDEKFHVEAYIQSDTAYYFDQMKLWELRGRVRVRTNDGLRFASEELFWDQTRHELYSNKFSKVITPEREMRGTYFKSNERFTNYIISNSEGSFVRGSDGMGSNPGDSILFAPDTTKAKLRTPTVPKAKTTNWHN